MCPGKFSQDSLHTHNGNGTDFEQQIERNDELILALSSFSISAIYLHDSRWWESRLLNVT